MSFYYYSHTLQIIEKCFFFIYYKQYNIFFHFYLFKIYWQYFNTILSFISYSLGENKLLHSNKLLPFKMKLINPRQKYPHIIESMLVFYISCNNFISYIFFSFFQKMFKSKAIKSVIIIYIQSYPVGYYWFIITENNYICPIFYFRYIISWIITIKSRSILIIFLYFKIRNPVVLWCSIYHYYTASFN